jgi:UDP-2,3-diacylglucosamine pyrophosphatase LpxH
MSDLHFEHMPDYGAALLGSLDRQGADALVLAGDILSLALPGRALEAFRRFRDVYGTVFYVPGNHEFYKTSVAEGEALLQALESEVDGFVVLSAGKTVERQGRRFLGGTMWFGRHPKDNLYRIALNDFALIEGFTPWVWDQNRAFTAWLHDELREGDVVITHHLPSERSSPPIFANSPLNMFFVCDQERLIEERRPAAWLHGHTHRAASYTIGSTIVRSNPKGYPKERPAGFRYDPMVIEI